MNRTDKITVTAWIAALVLVVLMAACPDAFAQVPIYTRPQAGVTNITQLATLEGGEDSITAFATGGQTSATALSASVTHHRVTTVATAGDSVKLPAATVGQEHYVRNDGAASMQVFGQATETINGVASATGVPQAPGMGVWYVSTTAGAWTTSPNARFVADLGTQAAPAYSFGNSAGGLGSGMYFVSSGNQLALASNGTNTVVITGNILNLGSGGAFGWSSNATPTAAPADTSIARAAANSIQFSTGTGTAGAATARTELNKAVASISDAVATSVLTITVPNAAHSASLLVRLTCSLGAGGAIGANEATATNTYVIALTRTAGVNATAAISTAFGGAATAVAGAATVTATAAMSAVSGAVGATNTFTVNATVTRSGGSSTNHTCLVYAQEMNANATGITIL